MLRALLDGGHSLKAPRVGIATRLIKCCLLATFFLGVGGCSSGSSAMLDTARALYNGPSSATPSSFNPNFAYLKTTIGGRTIYMVLGYIDSRPEGAVEVWYSNSGEVVRLLNGRLVGTTGLSTDWRTVRFMDWPDWPSASSGSSTPVQRYQRERDVMPGYRFGIRDEITRIAIPTPNDTSLAGIDPSSLQWYEERSVSLPATASVPTARFGVSRKTGSPVVIYSEQCISSSLCMSFERWTPTSPTANASASAGT
ncbi:YjbF family lipoprotein [Variovorax sp. Varisp41]|eukprot:TRINITY_DN14122_c0_g1_i1.p1 TRINITY_DN14122_c0_g1~~TRINITY_DN14122_c0_g1_i1.p1  ORF type:complete len:254 (-),score=16.87 TRINITY_DN14122_c0_g1_i1:451-1212(-)